MKELTNKESVRFSELASIVGFASTASRALKAMEESGLVSKRVVNEPYRPVIYSLTEKGRRLVRVINEIEKL